MPNKCLQRLLRRKPMRPRRWLRPKLMPNNEDTVGRRAMRVEPLRALGPGLGSSIPLDRVRPPMTSRGPLRETSRGNGMALQARTDAATCASRTPTRCAVMDTKRRARPPRDERRSLVNSKPRPLGGAFFGRSARLRGSLLFSPLEARGPPARVVPTKIVPWGERWPTYRRSKSRACLTSAG